VPTIFVTLYVYVSSQVQRIDHHLLHSLFGLDNTMYQYIILVLYGFAIYFKDFLHMYFYCMIFKNVFKW